MAMTVMLFTSVLFSGCASQRTLEEGGVYSSMAAVNADLIVSDAVEVMDKLILIEARNPAYFASDERLVKFMERVHAELEPPSLPDEALHQYYTAQKLWEEAGEGTEGLSDVQRTMQIVRSLAREILLIIAAQAEDGGEL